MPALLPLLLLLWLLPTAVLSQPRADALQPPADTVHLHVGSPAIDGRVFTPHAARVRVYNAQGTLVQEWDNELFLGDSAGRPVMRWITTGRPVPANPTRPLVRILQTYDAVTLAPYGYLSTSSTGAYLQLSLTGTRVQGSKRANAQAPLEPVDVTLDAPGFYAGASDLVPVAAGLRTGQVFTAPVWSTNATRSERRTFVVRSDTTIDIEGTNVRSRRVDEFKPDGSLAAAWFLLRDAPFMVYGEVPLASGGVQRMTEVPIPPVHRRP